MPARAGPAVLSGSLSKCSSSLNAWRATRGSQLSKCGKCSCAPAPNPLSHGGDGHTVAPLGRTCVRTCWRSHFGGSFVPHLWRLAGHCFLGHLLLLPCFVLLPQVIPALLQESCALSMQGLVGVSLGLCITSRKMLWLRPYPMTGPPPQEPGSAL